MFESLSGPKALGSIFVIVVLSLGCSSTPKPRAPAQEGQSYEEAIALVCEVDKQAGIQSDADLITLGQERTSFVKAHVENPDGIYFVTLASVKTPQEQAAALREEAQKTGLRGCPLSDNLERDGAGGLSP